MGNFFAMVRRCVPRSSRRTTSTIWLPLESIARHRVTLPPAFVNFVRSPASPSSSTPTPANASMPNAACGRQPRSRPSTGRTQLFSGEHWERRGSAAVAASDRQRSVACARLWSDRRHDRPAFTPASVRRRRRVSRRTTGCRVRRSGRSADWQEVNSRRSRTHASTPLPGDSPRG